MCIGFVCLSILRSLLLSIYYYLSGLLLWRYIGILIFKQNCFVIHPGLLEETVRLQHKVEQLTEEKQEIETQAVKNKERLESQIHNLEGAVEEQISKSEKLAEERKVEIVDLRKQIEMAEKQQKGNKQFLDVSPDDIM